MTQHGRRMIVIGGGIAGLCAAVYAQECGYQVEVFEMHDLPGGLAASWHRGDYTFETCLHWLLGSSPKEKMHKQWQEVCDIDGLKFVYPEEVVRLVAEDGQSLSISANIERTEAAMLKLAPQDAAAIRQFVADIRGLAKFELPDASKGFAGNCLTYLHDVPVLGLLRRLSAMSCHEYGKKFTDPLLRSLFGEGEMARLSVLALFFSLAWRKDDKAGYAVGGSQALIQSIVEKLVSLGGRLRLGVKVEKILVEQGTAVGVQLAGGETIPADWVISAADGHATIFDLLEGKYTSKVIEKVYRDLETFPSYLQVSLGVARDLSDQPALATYILKTPLQVDPRTELRHIGIRTFHFDPTFAPAGKTPVTCFLPTRDDEYWVNLKHADPPKYLQEKHRIADAVIAILERTVPGIREAIEIVDISTPATVVRYTGNWKGSMEGWFPTPGVSFQPLPNALPGLKQFLMVGQWIMPGGGLPSGLITARIAVKAVCKQDRTPFAPGRLDPLHRQALSHS